MTKKHNKNNASCRTHSKTDYFFLLQAVKEPMYSDPLHLASFLADDQIH